MFKALSVEIVKFLTSLGFFNDVMIRNDKLYLFPIVASESNELPLTIYTLGEKKPGTKDLNQIEVEITFWFGIESYDECCEFTDKVEEALESNGNYNVNFSKIEFNTESKLYCGIISLGLI